MGQVAAGAGPGSLSLTCCDIFPGFDKPGWRVWDLCLLIALVFKNLLFCGSVNLLVYFPDNAILCTKKQWFSITNFISETQIFFFCFHWLKPFNVFYYLS